MTLKFRRNLPLVLLLVGILSVLALTMGNQKIVSYTVNTAALQNNPATSVTGNLMPWSDVFQNQSSGDYSQVNYIQP